MMKEECEHVWVKRKFRFVDNSGVVTLDVCDKCESVLLPADILKLTGKSNPVKIEYWRDNKNDEH